MTDPQGGQPRGQQLRAISAVLGRFVMGALFFGVLTPAGLVMRLAGRDALRLRPDRAAPSYWVTRPSAKGRRASMTRQF